MDGNLEELVTFYEQFSGNSLNRFLIIFLGCIFRKINGFVHKFVKYWAFLHVAKLRISPVMQSLHCSIYLPRLLTVYLARTKSIGGSK